jgi:5'-phosphate synthase pdxT subunit
MRIAVLALQGDYEAHAKALGERGADAFEARTADQVRAAEGLVLPGGESTALWRLMEGTGIADAIVETARQGKPILATCAGTILVAREVKGPDRPGLGLLDAVVQRNAYGRQLDSTVARLTDVDRRVLGDEPLEAVFIRAPKFVSLGRDVEVLARRDGDPVLVRSGSILAATFHPELTSDPRVAALFLSPATRARRVA